jgi:threonine/homoserine/homoserine lactone efflux protein
MSLFLEGVAIGLAIAAPVGPIGVLCVRRTLAQGRAAGFVSGLGAATADAFYASVAALGLGVVAHLLVGGEVWLRLAGGTFLVVLGVRTFLSRPATSASPDGGRALSGAYASTFLLTLANPTTILSFSAVFAGLGAGEQLMPALPLVPGVFLGSALWWLVLSGFTGLFRSRISTHGLRWVNRISGATIAAFGALALSGFGR